MANKKTISAKLSEKNYSKIHEFLMKYNKVMGEDLTMSKFIWRAVSSYANNIMREWHNTSKTLGKPTL